MGRLIRLGFGDIEEGRSNPDFLYSARFRVHDL